MTDKEYKREKERLLSKSKNKGLDLWEKVLAHYGIPMEKAKDGVYVPDMGRYMQLYFDEQQDKWLFREVIPSAS